VQSAAERQRKPPPPPPRRGHHAHGCHACKAGLRVRAAAGNLRTEAKLQPDERAQGRGPSEAGRWTVKPPLAARRGERPRRQEAGGGDVGQRWAAGGRAPRRWVPRTRQAASGRAGSGRQLGRSLCAAPECWELRVGAAPRRLNRLAQSMRRRSSAVRGPPPPQTRTPGAAAAAVAHCSAGQRKRGGAAPQQTSRDPHQKSVPGPQRAARKHAAGRPAGRPASRLPWRRRRRRPRPGSAGHGGLAAAGAVAAVAEAGAGAWFRGSSQMILTMAWA
jgi:hypothetical protein